MNFKLKNDGIKNDEYCGEPYSCRLPSIWDFLATIRKIGFDDVMLAKADQSRGYRQIPIDPADWTNQIFHLPQHGYFLDTRGIFGSRPCSTFMQRSNQALAWSIVNTEVKIDKAQLELSSNKLNATTRAITTYIDDSLLAIHRAVSSSVWSNVGQIHRSVNITMSNTPGHMSPPNRSMLALGFLVDCDSRTISIPAGKNLGAWEHAPRPLFILQAKIQGIRH